MTASSKRAVFFDRDGVLNRAVVRDRKPYPPADVESFELLPGVPEGCARLRAAGFELFVVTNQPDVARGTQSKAVVEAMHRLLRRRLPLVDIAACYHDSGAGCGCRKPAPGMLTRLASRWNVNLPGSFLVGDRWRDVDCGRRAGCRCVFIDYGYDEELCEQPDITVKDFTAATEWILAAALTESE